MEGAIALRSRRTYDWNDVDRVRRRGLATIAKWAKTAPDSCAAVGRRRGSWTPDGIVARVQVMRGASTYHHRHRHGDGRRSALRAIRAIRLGRRCGSCSKKLRLRPTRRLKSPGGEGADGAHRGRRGSSERHTALWTTGARTARVHVADDDGVNCGAEWLYDKGPARVVEPHSVCARTIERFADQVRGYRGSQRRRGPSMAEGSERPSRSGSMRGGDRAVLEGFWRGGARASKASRQARVASAN